MLRLTDDQKKELVRNTIAAFNSRELGLYFSYHTDDATSWEVYFEAPIRVKESEAFTKAYWRAFPDAAVDTQNMWVSGDVVFVENLVSATFRGEFLGQRPTGQRFVQREAVLFELKGDKISAVRIYLDRRTQEEQLGITKSNSRIP